MGAWAGGEVEEQASAIYQTEGQPEPPNKITRQNNPLETE